MEDAVRRGKRVVYTSPIKALSSQKYRDFKEEPEVEVGIMTGDVTLNARAQVLVMTTEILRNAIFENPELIEDVEFVVFDEVHFLDDRERGMVWEECFIFLPPHVRLICLSATIQNVEEPRLLDRAGSPPGERGHPRGPAPGAAVPLGPHRGGLDVPSRPPGAPPQEGGRDRQRERRRSAARDAGAEAEAGGADASAGTGRSGRTRRASSTNSNDDGRPPALVFSPAARTWSALPIATSAVLCWTTRRRRHGALRTSCSRSSSCLASSCAGSLMQMALRGVAYHHAGLLPVHKELVERMFTAGLIKLLFTTETFALGINMPARSVVFSQLRSTTASRWTGSDPRLHADGGTRRAPGHRRQGFAYSVLSDRRATEAPLERLFAGKPEPRHEPLPASYSTILHLVEAAGRERLYEAWERSFAQYQVRGGSEGPRAQRVAQRREVDRRLELLTELGYLDGERVTPRGKIARLLSGHEIQVTSSCSRAPREPSAQGRGDLRGPDPRGARALRRHVSAKVFGGLRRVVTGTVERAAGSERRGDRAGDEAAGLGLSEAVPPGTEGPRGRASRTTWTPRWRLPGPAHGHPAHAQHPPLDRSRRDPATVLDEAVLAVNRDEIDARRQLELG